MAGVFKAYDIRGIYNKDWNRDTAYRIGFFLPELLSASKIAVGRDVRASSDEIFAALSQGITDAGCDVYELGITSTPMVYFSTVHYDMDGSVMITASHNPPEYNGMKVSRKLALPVGYDTGLDQLEKLCQNKNIVKSQKPGKIVRIDVMNDYVSHLMSFTEGIRPLKVVVDTANGMGGLVEPGLLEKLGFTVINLFPELDGTFPNHLPDPLHEENLNILKQKVVEHKADLGIALDGDADRVMFIDETGKYISADLIIPLMGKVLLKNRSGHVLYDVRSSRSVAESVEKLGGIPFMWKVGHAFMKQKLRELDGIFGGELAGHYYFKDNFFTDSGAVAMLCVLNALSTDRRKMSEIIAEIKKYAFSGEINFRVENKQEIIDNLKKKYSDGKLISIDGIRMEFTDFWFNVRASNTEPYLRLVVEAKTQKLLEEKVSELKKIIAP